MALTELRFSSMKSLVYDIFYLAACSGFFVLFVSEHSQMHLAKDAKAV